MEIVVRALVVFIFLWIVTRAAGRSTLGELSTFELLLYVTMGDLVQQAVTQQDYSVTARSSPSPPSHCSSSGSPGCSGGSDASAPS